MKILRLRFDQDFFSRCPYPPIRTMSEKLCLQWNDFNENINSAFGKLRGDKEFTDVTLVCEDGQQIEAHKVILACSSPLFEKIIQKSKHPHPLIYLRGIQSEDFASILDLLYFGEAKVYQEDLDSFLAIAEEIKLKGVPGQTSSVLLEEQEESKQTEATMSKELITSSFTGKRDLPPYHKAPIKHFSAVAIPNQTGTNLKALDEKVKSMMEKGLKMIPSGKHANGTANQTTSSICKVCGKEGRPKDIRGHIEANHLEGISIPCDYCDKICPSRNSMVMHKSRFHK